MMRTATLAIPAPELRERLQVIDTEGWDGPTATELLLYLREHLVRLQVRDSGLSGPASAQAEATGWAIAWETFTTPGLRTATWPWTVLWTAVRRAVQGEQIADRYVTGARTGWDLIHATGADGDRLLSPVSFDDLVAAGWQPAPAPEPDQCRLLAVVVRLMVDAGWDRDLAAQVVVEVAHSADPTPPHSRTAIGWRCVATDLGVPPWQVRRVTVLICGGPGWPGLLTLLAEGGAAAVDTPAVRAAVRCTRQRSLGTPGLAAARTRRPTRKP